MQKYTEGTLIWSLCLTILNEVNIFILFINSTQNLIINIKEKGPDLSSYVLWNLHVSALWSGIISSTRTPWPTESRKPTLRQLSSGEIKWNQLKHGQPVPQASGVSMPTQDWIRTVPWERLNGDLLHRWQTVCADWWSVYAVKRRPQREQHVSMASQFIAIPPSALQSHCVTLYVQSGPRNAHTQSTCISSL